MQLSRKGHLNTKIFFLLKWNYLSFEAFLYKTFCIWLHPGFVMLFGCWAWIVIWQCVESLGWRKLMTYIQEPNMVAPQLILWHYQLKKMENQLIIPEWMYSENKINVQILFQNHFLFFHRSQSYFSIRKTLNFDQACLKSMN